jgi:hypothetical protein
MASTREQLRSEISFCDEVIRVSCLKGRTEKLNELSPLTDGMAYAPAGSASSQIGLLCCCVAFQRHHGGPWSILNETIWSLTSPRVKRISGSKDFHSSPQNDFCNKIGTKRTAIYLIPVSLLDNILRPLVMARGLDTPMLIILIGVLGGTVSYGITGLFLGPIVLAVIWELLVAWTRERESA